MRGTDHRTTVSPTHFLPPSFLSSPLFLDFCLRSRSLRPSYLAQFFLREYRRSPRESVNYKRRYFCFKVWRDSLVLVHSAAGKRAAHQLSSTIPSHNSSHLPASRSTHVSIRNYLTTKLLTPDSKSTCWLTCTRDRPEVPGDVAARFWCISDFYSNGNCRLGVNFRVLVTCWEL